MTIISPSRTLISSSISGEKAWMDISNMVYAMANLMVRWLTEKKGVYKSDSVLKVWMKETLGRDQKVVMARRFFQRTTRCWLGSCTITSGTLTGSHARGESSEDKFGARLFWPWMTIVIHRRTAKPPRPRARFGVVHPRQSNVGRSAANSCLTRRFVRSFTALVGNYGPAFQLLSLAAQSLIFADLNFEALSSRSLSPLFS